MEAPVGLAASAHRSDNRTWAGVGALSLTRKRADSALRSDRPALRDLARKAGRRAADDARDGAHKGTCGGTAKQRAAYLADTAHECGRRAHDSRSDTWNEPSRHGNEGAEKCFGFSFAACR